MRQDGAFRRDILTRSIAHFGLKPFLKFDMNIIKEQNTFKLLWKKNIFNQKKRASRRIEHHYRIKLITPNSQCNVCGIKATEVGHIIPRISFTESGFDNEMSYFDENLVPICGECNKVWIHYNYPKIISHYWGEQRAEIWNKYLRNTVKIARKKGIWVYLPANDKLGGWPGPVVIAQPANKSHFQMDVVGYLKLPRNMSNMPPYQPHWGHIRFRLTDLVGENPDIIKHFFVLNKRATNFLENANRIIY